MERDPGASFYTCGDQWRFHVKRAIYSVGAFYLILLGGCATPLPVTRIVHVHTQSYIPIPAALLSPCTPADLSLIKTNGDLLDALLSDQAAIQTCNGQLQQIGTIKAPAAATSH